MPDDQLSLDDAAVIARATVEKAAREKPSDFIQFGSVVSVAAAEGLVTYATVHVDGDPEEVTVMVPSLIGVVLYPGLRVAVLFDRPHGAYIIGSPAVSGVPMVRAGMCYGGET